MQELSPTKATASSDDEERDSPPGSGEYPNEAQRPQALPIEAIIRESGENDYSASPLQNSQDDIGIQLLCNAAALQGLDVRYHRRLIFEVFNEERSVVFRQNSPANSAVYTYCARQKDIAKKLMASHGVPVPCGSVFSDYDSALHFFQQLGMTATVKPADGSSGYGVTSGVTTEEQFSDAWAFAQEESPNVIVEQNISGKDIRVIVIAGEAQAAYVREPAHVVGDGKLTIRELVDNKNLLRKKNPSLRLDLIKRFDLLERNGRSLEDIPAAGEKVVLTSVANASAGGETVQVFDYLPQELKDIAEKAAKCFPGLVQVGVDLIQVSPESWRPGSPQAYVIEVNSNPGICDAVLPSYGPSIDIPGKLISHVFSEQGARLAASHPEVAIVLAESYPYQDYDQILGEGETRQMALIQQAAYRLNINVEPLTNNVYWLVGERDRCLFRSGMPEGVCMVTRKVTRNRDWMEAILPGNPLYPVKDVRTLNRFRLLVIGSKIVSALLIRQSGSVREMTRIEVGDLLHPSVLPIVDQTLTALFDPPVVGIDLYANDISSDMDHQPWRVLDAMSNPNLAWHHFPDQGLGRDVAAELVRATIPCSLDAPIPRVCEKFIVRGDVQQVGFRRWLKLKALQHGVSGWARNRQEGEERILETVVEGSRTAIAYLYTLCQQGPETASVQSIERSQQPCTGKTQFSIIG